MLRYGESAEYYQIDYAASLPRSTRIAADVQMALTWCVSTITAGTGKGSLDEAVRSTMKDHKRFLDERSIEIAKVVATAIGGELGKMCLSGDCQQARASTAAAVAASGYGLRRR